MMKKAILVMQACILEFSSRLSIFVFFLHFFLQFFTFCILITPRDLCIMNIIFIFYINDILRGNFPIVKGFIQLLYSNISIFPPAFFITVKDVSFMKM